MPTTFKCPTCKRALEVPDELMGKRVKCPACKMIFTAMAGGSTPSAKGESSRPQPPKPRSEEEVRVRRKPAAPPPEEEDDEEEEEETPRVRKKGVPHRKEEEEEQQSPRVRRKAIHRYEEDEKDEEEDEDEEEEEEEVRPRRRRRPMTSSRQRARSAVLLPAICLMVVGGLGIALAGSTLAIRLGGLSLFAPEAREDDGMGKVQWVSSEARSIRGGITALCWGLAVLGGGIQMRNLSSFKSVMSACILAMLPCNPCCLLGIPFGIWGLVAINRWDVKREFD